MTDGTQPIASDPDLPVDPDTAEPAPEAPDPDQPTDPTTPGLDAPAEPGAPTPPSVSPTAAYGGPVTTELDDPEVLRESTERGQHD